MLLVEGKFRQLFFNVNSIVSYSLSTPHLSSPSFPTLSLPVLFSIHLSPFSRILFGKRLLSPCPAAAFSLFLPSLFDSLPVFLNLRNLSPSLFFSPNFFFSLLLDDPSLPSLSLSYFLHLTSLLLFNPSFYLPFLLLSITASAAYYASSSGSHPTDFACPTSSSSSPPPPTTTTTAATITATAAATTTTATTAGTTGAATTTF